MLFLRVLIPYDTTYSLSKYGIFQQLADGTGGLFVVVEAGDDRGTDLHGQFGEGLEKLLEIGEDEFVAHTGGPLVLFGIGMLHVIQHIVEVGGSFFEAFPVVKAGGLDSP